MRLDRSRGRVKEGKSLGETTKMVRIKILHERVPEAGLKNLEKPGNKMGASRVSSIAFP
jgi:hypothetical protein